MRVGWRWGSVSSEHAPADPNDTPEEHIRNLYRTYYDNREGEPSPIAELAKRYPSEQTWLYVHWRDIYQFDPALAQDVLDYPRRMQRRFQSALLDYDLPVQVDFEGVTVRFTDLPADAIYDVGQYRKELIGTLVGIRGQVTKKTQPRMRIIVAEFECLRCGCTTDVQAVDEKVEAPHECPECERRGPFRRNDRNSEMVNDQLLRLQVPPERTQGHSEATVDVRLEDDLVDVVEPGDRVFINGELVTQRENHDSALFNYALEAMSIEVQETDFEDIDYEEHLDDIEAIAADGPLASIEQSIAPSIKGLAGIKRAVGLQMFGGVRKTLPDGAIERGDSHVLLMGDPGTAKSKILAYADDLAPKSVYTDGQGSTAAGLTASAVRDEFGEGQWSIEGGSLVKAHRGLCCIDELDDMHPDDRSAMNTALEKQQVPVSKAGITATLPAQTRILAAANPKDGRFDKYQPIAQQFNLDPTLVSRFDLIFTLSDTPDPEQDEEIIAHKLKAAQAGQARAAGDDFDADAAVVPEIEPEVLRAYIAYARQHITPTFTEEALDAVADEFTSLRLANLEAYEDPDEAPVPVTYRKQEAIHRLAEASARVRLSDTVDAEDVELAVSLIRECLQDVGIDTETGELDVDVQETGKSKTQKQRMSFIRETVNELSDHDSGAGFNDIVEVATAQGYNGSQVRHAIDKLKDAGDIYEQETNRFRGT